MSKKPMIIAVCGIHGSGKTTLIDALKVSCAGTNYTYLKNDYYENIKMIEYRHAEYELREVRRDNNDYTQAYVWAKTFDYLQYYQKAIRPALAGQQTIVSDRWSYCYRALAMTIPEITGPCWRLLKLIPRPDIIVYMDVDPEKAYHRIISRGNATPEETIPQLAVLRDNYEKIFDLFGWDNVYKFCDLPTAEIELQITALIDAMCVREEQYI